MVVFVGEDDYVVDDIFVAWFDINATDPSGFFDVGGVDEVPILVVAFGGDGVFVWHFPNHVWFTIGPSLEKFRGGRLFFCVSSGGTGIGPIGEEFDVSFAKIRFVAEFDVGWNGFPGWHSSLGGGESNHVAVPLCVRISFQTKWCIFTRAVALDTVSVENGGHMFSVSDLFDPGEFFGSRFGRWGLADGCDPENSESGNDGTEDFGRCFHTIL